MYTKKTDKDTKLDGDMLENFNNLIFFIHLL